MKKQLLKLIPQSVKNAIEAEASLKARTRREFIETKLPKIELAPEHISNIQVLSNREELLKHMPKQGNVAELGVDTGTFSKKIMEINKPAKLHLVDAWDTPRYGTDKQHAVTQKFKAEIDKGTIQMHIGYSTDCAFHFEDGYFDWIYIDTNHSYQTTFAELRAYAPKMKPGGIMAGHDFINGNWISTLRYGVREAVYEFCVEANWELIYLTMEIGDNPSFAIKKI